MVQLLKRWHESTFYLAGQPLRLKLKALSFEEAPEFARALVPKGDADFFARISPEFARNAFARYVKPAEEIQDEEGGAIENGEKLFALATPGLVAEVIARLEELFALRAPEGKASSSPSTSGPAGTSDDGASPATSTEHVDGPTP